ncbi:MAG: fructoselysine 6-kinase [Bauldia sp.]|nr:fructoselysine 6-kinase [Bauldia sp.]
MAPLAVATLGDNCIDRYLAIGRSTVGGNAVNVAVHLARRGIPAAYYGAVGRDTDGERVIAALRASDVDIAGLRTQDGRTAYTDIAFGDGGERIIAHEDFGVCAGYRPDPAELDTMACLRHVHLGWLDDGDAARRTLLAAGASVSQDLSVTASSAGRHAAGLAIAFASAGPDLGESEALVVRLLEEGAKLAVVTCGAAGSLASDGGPIARMDAMSVPVVDTLGAGDTFIAAFIAARFAGAGLVEALAAGRSAAAETCGHLGGFPQAPQALR